MAIILFILLIFDTFDLCLTDCRPGNIQLYYLKIESWRTLSHLKAGVESIQTLNMLNYWYVIVLYSIALFSKRVSTAISCVFHSFSLSLSFLFYFILC